MVLLSVRGSWDRRGGGIFVVLSDLEPDLFLGRLRLNRLSEYVYVRADQIMGKLFLT